MNQGANDDSTLTEASLPTLQRSLWSEALGLILWTIPSAVLFWIMARSVSTDITPQMVGTTMLLVCCIAALAVGYQRLAKRRRGADPGEAWWGWDASLRAAMTPVVTGACVALTFWTVSRAQEGLKLGGVGSLLVLVVFAAMCVKFAAESYVFSYYGGDESPRQQSARKMIGPLARLTSVRYALGSLGGVIFPLGVQILATGSKNIPSVTDPMIPAVVACLAIVTLIPGEIAERRLFYKA